MWILGVLAVVVIGGGAYIATRPAGENAAIEQKDEAMMEDIMAKEDSMAKDEAMKKDEGAMMEEGDAMMEKKGSYEAYSPEKLSLAKDGKVALFFHATWCPTCRAIESEIQAGAMIPAGVHILKVDYDTATALRQKYGVTVQHTFVQVDATGAALQKFSDATSVAAALARLK